jgi:hypothetical protein
MGEVEYNRLKLRQALHWISENRNRAVILTLERVGAFWFPTETGRIRDITVGQLILSCSTLLALPGLFLLYRYDKLIFGNMMLWIVLYPPAYYLIGQGQRSRYPILWVTLLPSAYFICTLMEIQPLYRKSEVEVAIS